MKTTEISIIFIVGTLTLLVFISFVVLILIEYRRKQVRYVTEKLRLKHQYLNEVLQTQLEVQEQSFKYVSEEIHDNIAQTLSLAKLRLYKTAEKTQDEVLKKGVDSSIDLVTTALNDLRNLSHILNGGFVQKLTLRESIEKELGYAHDVKDIKGQLNVTGKEYEPDSEKKLLIFRIIQESMNNAMKHGNANEIYINLTNLNSMFTIQICDNGKGFDTKLINESKGLGLHNIHVRAKMLGNLEIHSEEGKGTTVTLMIKTNEK